MSHISNSHGLVLFRVCVNNSTTLAHISHYSSISFSVRSSRSVPSKTVVCVTVQTVGKTITNAPIDNPQFIANCVIGDTCSALILQAMAPPVAWKVLYAPTSTAALAVEFDSVPISQ